MTFDEYQAAAERTMVAAQRDEDRLVNAALGLAGESGEVADHVKKLVFHQRALDTEAVILELGDVLWYIAQAASALDTTLHEIATRNIAKLAKRYPQGVPFGKPTKRC